MTQRQLDALHNHGNRFTSANQPTRRKQPSLIRRYIKRNHLVTKADINAIVSTLLFASTENELKAMIDTDDKRNHLPVIVALLIDALLNDLKRGSLKSINALLDRLYGKAAQCVEVPQSRHSDIPTDANERQELAERIKRQLATTA